MNDHWINLSDMCQSNVHICTEIIHKWLILWMRSQKWFIDIKGVIKINVPRNLDKQYFCQGQNEFYIMRKKSKCWIFWRKQNIVKHLRFSIFLRFWYSQTRKNNRIQIKHRGIHALILSISHVTRTTFNNRIVRDAHNINSFLGATSGSALFIKSVLRIVNVC